MNLPAPKMPLDQQQRVVDQMRASPRPCAMRNDGLAEGAEYKSMVAK